MMKKFNINYYERSYVLLFRGASEALAKVTAELYGENEFAERWQLITGNPYQGAIHLHLDRLDAEEIAAELSAIVKDPVYLLMPEPVDDMAGMLPDAEHGTPGIYTFSMGSCTHTETTPVFEFAASKGCVLPGGDVATKKVNYSVCIVDPADQNALEQAVKLYPLSEQYIQVTSKNNKLYIMHPDADITTWEVQLSSFFPSSVLYAVTFDYESKFFRCTVRTNGLENGTFFYPEYNGQYTKQVLADIEGNRTLESVCAFLGIEL